MPAMEERETMWPLSKLNTRPSQIINMIRRISETGLIIKVADPDSIGSVDPDPDSASGSGSRRAKMTPKVEKILKVHLLKCWMVSFQS